MRKRKGPKRRSGKGSDCVDLRVGGLLNLASEDDGYIFTEMSLSCGWRDDSTVKCVCCSYRGPKFDSQHPAPGDLIPSVVI